MKEESLSGSSIAELQLAEQGLQNLLLQKQMFQIELIETNNALEELKKSKEGEVFKIVGSLMFKSDKAELAKELEKKKELLDLRIRAIEKQEESLKNKLIKAREEVLKGLKR
ncbi:MAG: prefoldin subunit beta [Candidatus Pacearchaeota archaeon]|nr:prefoldin subunit beta [Candidatus Pacearchaeota archaeon]